MSDEQNTYMLCPGCGERSNPSDDPTLIYAVEMLNARTMGSGRQTVDGLGAYFHPGHLMPGYAQRQRPDSAA